MSEDKLETSRRGRRRRILLWVLFVLLLIAVGTVVTAPVAMRVGAVKWLKNQGRDYAEVKNIDLNPFTGRFLMEGLTGGDERPNRLSAGHILVDTDYLPLWSRRVLLQRLELSDIVVDIQRGEDGAITVGGIPLPEAGPPEVEDRVDYVMWGFGASGISVRNTTVTYTDPLLAVDLTIIEADIEPIATWRPSEGSEFKLSLTLNDAPIHIEGTGAPFGKKPNADVRLRVETLALDILATVLDRMGFKNLSGNVTIDAAIRGEFDSDSQEIEAACEGSTSLAGLGIDAPQGSAKLSTVTWNGRFGASGPLLMPSVEADGALALEGVEAVAPVPMEGASPLAVTANMNAKRITAVFDPAVKSVQVTFDGQVSAKTGAVDLPDLVIQDIALSWDGHVEAAGALPLPPIKAKGEFGLQLAALATPTFTLGPSEAGGEPLSLSVTVRDLVARLLADAGLELSLDSGLRLAHMAVQMPQAEVTGGPFSWDGQVQASGALPLPVVEAKGAARTQEVAAALKDVGYAAACESASWVGSAVFDPSASFPITASGDVQGTAISVRDERLARQAVALDGLDVTGLAFESLESTAIDKVLLTGLQLLERKLESGEEAETHVLRLASLQAEGLRREAASIEASVVTLDSVQGYILRGAGGQIEALEWDPGSGVASAEEAQAVPFSESVIAPVVAVVKEEASSLQVGVGRLVISGDNRLVLHDRTMDPPFDLTIAPFEIELSEISMARPDHLSPVRLKASIGSYTTIDVEGGVAPFAPLPNLDLTARLEGAALPQFTPYTEQNIGYRLQSGRIDTDMTVALTAGDLVSEIVLSLQNLQVERLSADEQDGVNQQLGMPLDVALSLLRDGNGDIHLTIPVEGDISDPEIDISDAIRQAIAGATAKAVKGAAMAFFAPVGIAMKVGKLATGQDGIAFEPVVFAPKDTELDDRAKGHLDRLAGVLKDRPQVRLNLCGVASPQDSDAPEAVVRQAAAASDAPPPLVPAGYKHEPEAAPEPEAGAPPPEETGLLGLAGARAAAVKEYLVEAGGVDADRLFLCSPAVAEEEDAVPRVDISL